MEVRNVSDAVLVALITGICAVVGQWLISRNQNQKRKIDEAVRDARLDDRLAGVERRLDEHNRYAQKFETISVNLATITTEIKNIKEKIS